MEPSFTPGGERSAVPLVVAVGRLVPVKRFDLLVEALVAASSHDQPDLRAVIVGEGYERPALEAQMPAPGRRAGLSCPGSSTTTPWSTLPFGLGGRLDVAARGVGHDLTEAGACATPAVATRISGHEDAVVDGMSGLLVDSVDGMADALSAVLRDEVLRRRLGNGALEHAGRLTWDATARGTLAALGAEALARTD